MRTTPYILADRVFSVATVIDSASKQCLSGISGDAPHAQE